MKDLLYIVSIFLIVLGACNKDEEEVTEVSDADRNWFVVPDKPGELNQLLYQIYQESRIAIFVNDTLGQEYYAKDLEGNLIVRYETFNLSYHLFGLTQQQGISPEGHAIVQSSDTAAMIKAAQLIRDKVIPYIPEEGVGRPKCYFMVDSINEICYYSPDFVNNYEIHVSLPSYVALKGIVVGKLHKLLAMSEEEKEEWCGQIIAVGIVSWLINNVDMDAWKAITDEGMSGSWYGQQFYSFFPQFNKDIEVEAGMFGWQFSNAFVKKTMSYETDVREFVARVYAYWGREREFLENYAVNSKVYRKFQLMRSYLEEFQRKCGVNWNRK